MSCLAPLKKGGAAFDILIHCLAFANRDDLTGDFSDTSRAGFDLALSVSAYSLVQLAKGAKELMPEGGQYCNAHLPRRRTRSA